MKLQKIDIDLITQLRYQGHKQEAESLLQTFRDNNKKEKIQHKEELINKQRKISKVKRNIHYRKMREKKDSIFLTN